MTKPKSLQPKLDPAQQVTGALAERPGATGLEIATAAGVGHSTAQRHLTALESVGIARREAGGWHDGKKFRDRWFLVTAAHPNASADASPTDGRPTEGQASSSSGHLAKGELASLILGYLAAHPEDLGPSAVGKELERSSGAVANALERLVASGQVRLVSEKPRRYRLAQSKKR
jgi:DNA-binding IclR family transcriptional regulator